MRCALPVAFLFLILLAAFRPGIAQESHGTAPADTVSRVPALEKFHEVIFVIWHDAWPKKDTGKLESLLPDVKAGVDSIAGARLPGMLREKKGVWEHEVAELRAAAEAYAEAVKLKDAEKLLKAAEELHARYEGLVRVIRPAMKEVEDFHATLYVLYHSYLPEYSLDNIARAAGDLKAKMARLEEAKLPERHKSKSDAFTAARKELGNAVASLHAAVRAGEEPAVRAAVESVHSCYEALTRVFER